MKVGVADFGMNVWDGGLYDIEERLEALKGIGYDGTERCSAVTESTVLARAAIYHRLGMDFTTCHGPDAQASIQWTAAFGKSYVWLEVGNLGRSNDASAFDVFCRKVNRFAETCKRWNIRAALHNHLGQIVENQEEMEDFLAKCPDCGLVFDTAHLAAAGGDPVEIVTKYSDRLCVVHIKDWLVTDETVGLDKWQQRGRFVELGAGNIQQDLDGVIKALADHGYEGWIHVEHDMHQQDPLVDLAVSRAFLRERGVA